jgi:hypothetical protein
MVLPPLPEGLEMTADRLAVNAGAVLASMAAFSGCFVVAYRWALPRWCRGFPAAGRALRADFASRAHSTLHALLVPAGLVLCVRSCGLWEEPLLNTCRPAEAFFSISIGYFLVDLVLIVLFRTEFWQVFVLHHSLALLPYAINNFVPHCSHSHLLLSLMLGVEVSTVFLNVKWWLEQTDTAAGLPYAAAVYATYASWFLVRVLNPIYVVVLMVVQVFPYYGWDRRVVVSYAVVMVVALFCWYCFLFLFTPEVWHRLRAKRPPRPPPPVLDPDGTSDRRVLVAPEDDESEKDTTPRSVSRNRSSTLLHA